MRKLLNSFLTVNEKESSIENVVVLLVLKKKALSGVCSCSIRLPNAKPA